MRLNRCVLPALAASLALALPLAACGDSDDGGGGSSELIDFFVSEGAPQDEAECVAGELSGTDTDAVLAALQSDEVPDEDVATAIIEAVTACGIE